MSLLEQIDDLEPLGRSLKCRVYSGRFRGSEVIAKVLEHEDPVWRWYFEREVAALPLLAPIGAPDLIAVDRDAGVLVAERHRGAPLARNRAAGPIDDAVIDRALAIGDAAAAIDLSSINSPPSPEVRETMRSRLLEDPTAPLGWFTEGVDRCVALGLIDRARADRIAAAIESGGAVCQHGDLLPRNVLVDGDAVALIDWECAGDHARDWDRALLWANVDAAGRSRIEGSIGADPERNRGFRAMCAFALAREVKFARAGTTIRSRRQGDLEAALARL